MQAIHYSILVQWGGVGGVQCSKLNAYFEKKNSYKKIIIPFRIDQTPLLIHPKIDMIQLLLHCLIFLSAGILMLKQSCGLLGQQHLCPFP